MIRRHVPVRYDLPGHFDHSGVRAANPTFSANHGNEFPAKVCLFQKAIPLQQNLLPSPDSGLTGFLSMFDYAVELVPDLSKTTF